MVRGGGAVRYGPQNVGGIINFSTRAIPTGTGLHGEAGVRYTAYDHGGGDSTQYNASAAPATMAWARPCCTPARTAAAGARAAMTASTTWR